MTKYSIAEILKFLKQQACLEEVEFNGSSESLNHIICGLNTVTSAQSTELVCIFNHDFYESINSVDAGLIITSFNAPKTDIPTIRLKNPYLAYAFVSSLFVVEQKREGIDPTASIAKTADIHEDAVIGPFVVIEDYVKIGKGVTISSHCSIAQHCEIGIETKLHAHVTVMHSTSIGDRCEIHSGAVIGGDGFGFAPKLESVKDASNWQKIEQLGKVWIKNDVSIGSNTTIDRGALGDTVIGHGVIIDNLVQVAHNVSIGNNTAIAGCVGIAGSSIIGENCQLAGGVGIAGHLEITDNVVITGMSMVTKSITQPGSYSAGTPLQESKTWRKNAARFARLDRVIRKFLKS